MNHLQLQCIMDILCHSKTSFILSNFKNDEFKVVYVLNNPFIGGGNIDLLLCDYCKTQLKKKI